MRAVARELGVTHGALYRYFPDLQSLLTALAADIASDLKPAPEHLPWQDWLRETARSIRQATLTHPEYGTSFTWPILVPEADSILAAGIRVLTRTFSPRDALVALSLTGQFADGFARAERQSVAPTALPELESVLAYAEVVDEIIDVGPDETFEQSLSIVIAGIDATLPQRDDAAPEH